MKMPKWTAVLFLILTTLSVQAADIFDFFETEAKVSQMVTASRIPLSVRQTPATVYVITGDEIETMGAQTLWDALRTLPGVDVMTTRTFYGEVSIRGLNKPLNNRTLVQVDGRTVLNGLFDTVYWEGIPVTMAEIDRIEVVLGPASALYGANAMNGVINIITKTPDQLKGGRLSYRVGEYQTHLGSAVFGNRQGNLSYKASVGFRQTNRFENADLEASDVRKVGGLLGYDNGLGLQLSVSGGFVNHTTQFATGGSEPPLLGGNTSFLRVDAKLQSTRLRAFWNRGRPRVQDFSPTEVAFNPDLYDIQLERAFEGSGSLRWVVGTSYRRSIMESNVYVKPHIVQNDWAGFGEGVWLASDTWSVVASGRIDRNPNTGWVLSPKGSIIFLPGAQHALRISAGTSFRNPTLTEGNLNIIQDIEVPFPIDVRLQAVGNLQTDPENLHLYELAYTGTFDKLHFKATGFHYRLKKMISTPDLILVEEALPEEIRLRATFGNLPGDTRAWGGELAAEIPFSQHAKGFANYAYQHIAGTLDAVMPIEGGPRHKVNMGIQTQKSGWSFAAWAHWVDQTTFYTVNIQKLISEQSADMFEVSSYWLLNGRLSYDISKTGLSVGVEGFNLLDHRHYQISGGGGSGVLDANGEALRRRVNATVSYRF
ncbi:MAG: outer membrane receptor for ferrienterochelin and colicin [Candidatus Latescibacterota bacterium]|jgi:outer membrane receptor for ferrienterochelin and colicin